jgi:hypothetical protein
MLYGLGTPLAGLGLSRKMKFRIIPYESKSNFDKKTGDALRGLLRRNACI